MRHGRNKKILNMSSQQRKAVMKNLATSFVSNGRIKTTLARAKYFVPYMEKMITIAKNKTLSNTRLLSSMLNSESVNGLYEIAEKFANRNGGYIRIIKTWQRYGDAAKTAVVEFAF